MRYLGQRDQFRCGPVALINLAKWQGKRVTSADLPKITKRCRCVKRGPGTKYYGTHPRNFARALHHKCARFTYDRLKSHLKKGAVVLRVLWDRRHGHYFLIDGTVQGGFRAINFNYKTVCVLPGCYVKQLLKHSLVWRF